MRVRSTSSGWTTVVPKRGLGLVARGCFGARGRSPSTRSQPTRARARATTPSIELDRTRRVFRRPTARRSATGPAARDGLKRPSSDARHYHGSLGARYGPVSCSALLGGAPSTERLTARFEVSQLVRG